MSTVLNLSLSTHVDGVVSPRRSGDSRVCGVDSCRPVHVIIDDDAYGQLVSVRRDQTEEADHQSCERRTASLLCRIYFYSFFEYNSHKVDQTVLTVREGITIIRKKL